MTTKLKHYGTKEFERDYGELTFEKLLESHGLSEEEKEKNGRRFFIVGLIELKKF